MWMDDPDLYLFVWISDVDLLCWLLKHAGVCFRLQICRFAGVSFLYSRRFVYFYQGWLFTLPCSQFICFILITCISGYLEQQKQARIRLPLLADNPCHCHSGVLEIPQHECLLQYSWKSPPHAIPVIFSNSSSPIIFPEYVHLFPA